MILSSQIFAPVKIAFVPDSSTFWKNTGIFCTEPFLWVRCVTGLPWKDMPWSDHDHLTICGRVCMYAKHVLFVKMSMRWLSWPRPSDEHLENSHSFLPFCTVLILVLFTRSTFLAHASLLYPTEYVMSYWNCYYDEYGIFCTVFFCLFCWYIFMVQI